uniref:tRNA(Met) cytidine acetyltransferase TmcA n=1 Tax=uncultured Thiotrichaceae bacterium TaxID=298394 RepID=A0A6S6U5M5_9GAMM|nr:MAG: Predicted P-loop ATPase fused to an acetyltransferase COG1444 [uncultured Thiotrichaceae bacterium]
MQRHLSCISGSCVDVLQRAINQLQYTERVLWVTHKEVPLSGDSSSLCLPANKARTVLGREFFIVVFDAWSGLDVNALAAVSGTICAGGSLVLLTPPLADWPQYADPDYKRFLPHPWQPDQLDGHFLRRFIRLLTAYPLLDLYDVPLVPDPAFSAQTRDDQLLALDTILEAREAVVMTAARGRGKSAVLGMVVECLKGKPPLSPLLQSGNEGDLKILLTAPSRAAAETVFKHTQFPPEFIAPDDLLQTLPEADVLLVDEAAMIPVPMLLAMQKHYPRCVFSTTSQGYEGSGRGFVLRFQAELNRCVPDWKNVRLNTPIRWSEGDQLESLLNQLLLLDVELASCDSLQGSENVSYRMISQQALLEDEALLRQLFALLVNAHYQTRPSDLRQMLDAPQLTIHVLEQNKQPIAVALLTGEGGLDADLVAEIHAGKRRPHGHLLAQSLTFHAGIEGAACLYGERVMRIAVHPGLQGQGLGSDLLNHVIEYAQKQQVDYVGVSYAVSPELLSFWQRAGFVSVRLGFRKDKASGARSLMQVCGLSDAGLNLSRQAVQKFEKSKAADRNI